MFFLTIFNSSFNQLVKLESNNSISTFYINVVFENGYGIKLHNALYFRNVYYKSREYNQKHYLIASCNFLLCILIYNIIYSFYLSFFLHSCFLSGISFYALCFSFLALRQKPNKYNKNTQNKSYIPKIIHNI